MVEPHVGRRESIVDESVLAEDIEEIEAIPDTVSVGKPVDARSGKRQVSSSNSRESPNRRRSITWKDTAARSQ
jgi:hypothetical protein